VVCKIEIPLLERRQPKATSIQSSIQSHSMSCCPIASCPSIQHSYQSIKAMSFFVHCWWSRDSYSATWPNNSLVDCFYLPSPIKRSTLKEIGLRQNLI